MSIYFFDSSALLKRYVPEIGTNWVENICSHAATPTIFIAQITSTELISALARRAREGNISLTNLQMSLQLIDNHLQARYSIIRLQKSVTQTANQFLLTHSLRAMDALQLASAYVIYQRLSIQQQSDFQFIAADQRLLDVAQKEGLSVDNPQNYP